MRLTLLFLLALSLGCASAKLTVTEPLAVPVAKTSFEVEPDPEDSMTAEQQSRLRSTLTTALRERGVIVLPEEEASASLHGTVDRYEPGNRALRYLVGFGAGSGKFGSVWSVRDAGGEEIGACRVDGSISMGAFGGSYDDVIGLVGDRLSEFLLRKKGAR